MSGESTFLLATRSEDKLREAREIMSGVGARIMSLADARLPETPEEGEEKDDHGKSSQE